MTMQAPANPAALPLVMFDTNVLFDYFLGRDPDVEPLAKLSRRHVEIRVPEFVLFEFRGSILRELGRIEKSLNDVRGLTNDLERADQWMSAVDLLRNGAEFLREDLDRLRGRIDPFLTVIRRDFEIEPHSERVHYLGDLRYVQGYAPDDPKKGIQDCRIMEAVLAIVRADSANVRPARFLLSKDGDFLKKKELHEELKTVGVELVGSVGPIYGRFGPRP